MFGLDLNWIIYIGLAVLMFYMMSKGGGCCGGHGGHGGHGNDGGHSHGGYGHGGNAMNSDLETFKDPVCGMYVSKHNAITRLIDGQTYYFCSESCANEFSRNR